MGIEWSEKFTLGIDEIDQQHRTIVEQFAKLSNAVQEGDAVEPLAEMVTFLGEYAKSHFATEEGYMQRYAYPGLAEQQAEHAKFTRDAEELLQQLETAGASRELALTLTGKLVRWIIQHIGNHDRVMVDFVKERMAAEG